LDGVGTFLCENTGNNQNELKWTGSVGGISLAFRDFNCDGKVEIGTGYWGAEVWECTGDDQYEQVWSDTFQPGDGPDVWSTADIDGDSRPEFFISYFNWTLHRMCGLSPICWTLSLGGNC
jgi:hypothetical protein